MAVLQHNDLRKGVKIELDGQPFVIIDSDFVKPGKGQAFTRCRIRNYLNGNTIERTIKSNEKVAKADIESTTCQYLYSDGDFFHFMDGTTFDQFQFTPENVGDTVKWLSENLEYNVLFWNGRPLSVEAPNHVELEITQCDPGVAGNTAQGATKPATLSSGAVVNVPLFVNEGDWIRVDTRTGDYTERVKK